jgi:hypothetical protein
MTQTQRGREDVIRKYGKEMWQEKGFILTRGNELLSPLIEEYGHDFNMNGCFDEPGHNKLLLPVSDDNAFARAFVYIEYTPNYKSGFPMISVGRYYR